MAIVGEFHGEMGSPKMLTTEDTEDTEFSNKETTESCLATLWRNELQRPIAERRKAHFMPFRCDLCALCN